MHLHWIGKEHWLAKQQAAYVEKLVRSNGEKLGDEFTANFHRRLRDINSIKSALLRSYCNQGLSLLDLSAEIGSFIESKRREFLDLAGLETIPVYSNHPVKFPRETQKLDRCFRGRKFDIILMVNFLEYEYCPYSRMIEVVARLKKDGKICLAVCTDNNPQKNFHCRTHEFSNLSFETFLRRLDMPFERSMIGDIATAVITTSHSRPLS